MGINPMELTHMKQRFSIFAKQHPRVISFFETNGHQMKEGNVLEFKIKTAEGKEYMAFRRRCGITEGSEEPDKIVW